MSDEYNLTEAGVFDEKDLLEFRDSELEKGNTVSRIYVTRIQANHLMNSIQGNPPYQPTGKKLVDYWNHPKSVVGIQKVHGIDVFIQGPKL